MTTCADTSPDHHIHNLHTVVLRLDGREYVYPDEPACHVDGLIRRLQDADAQLVSVTDQQQTWTGYAV